MTQHHKRHYKRIGYALAMSLAILGATAQAHGPAMHVSAPADAPISTEETPFGKQGDPKKVTRTIVIDMKDTMRFGPDEIRVRQGDTIRFIAKNQGKVMHEIVLGTLAALKEHGELMQKNPEMEHEEPYMAHVGPGKKEEMVWHFTKPGVFHYACLLPGHFEAGMVGRITVLAD